METETKKYKPHLFQKGVSGNPGGRPRVNPEVREILKAHSVEAARKLVEMINHENPKIAMWAITDILDRTQGKALQAQDINMEISGHVDVRAQIREILLNRREPPTPEPSAATEPEAKNDRIGAEGTD